MSDVFRELSHTCLLKQSSTLALVAGLEAVVVGLTIEIVSLVPATFLLPKIVASVVVFPTAVSFLLALVSVSEATGGRVILVVLGVSSRRVGEGKDPGRCDSGCFDACTARSLCSWVLVMGHRCAPLLEHS